jgi:hypothetical protein
MSFRKLLENSGEGGVNSDKHSSLFHSENTLPPLAKKQAEFSG